MKRVAIVIHKLYNGGSEHAACNMSLMLERYFETILIAFDGRNASYPHTERLYDLQVPAAHSLLERAQLLPKRVSRMCRIKRENNVSASIALLPGPSMASALSRQKNEKIIMSVRNFLSKQEPPKSLKALKTRFTAAKSDCVVAVSRVAAMDLAKNFGIPEKKLRVIYNSVDPVLLQGDIAKPVPGTGPLAVTMGRLHGQKGHWHLIRAMREVVRKIPDARLAILGDGEYRERLDNLIKDLGLENNVFLMGYVAPPYGYVRAADVFVLSSLFEGMPNALLEAMACGLPVISTDCPSGPREILAPEASLTETVDELYRAPYGILIPTPDAGRLPADAPLTKAEQCMADALVLMLSDESLRREYAQRSLQRTADFAPEKIAAQWAALINELTGEEEAKQ